MKVASDFVRECKVCGKPLFIFPDGQGGPDYKYYVACADKKDKGHVEASNLSITEALDYLREGGESDSTATPSGGTDEGETAEAETDEASA